VYVDEDVYREGDSMPRRFRALVIGCVALLLLPSCGGLADRWFPSSGSGGDGLLVSGFALPDVIATERVAVFEKTYPQIPFEINEGSFDAQQFLSSVSSGNPPDLLYIERNQLGAYAARGAVMPLTDCIRDNDIDLSQYRPPALAEASYNGQVYGLPDFYNITVMMLSHEALQQSGLPVAALDTSDPRRLMQAHRELTEIDGGRLDRIGIESWVPQPQSLPMWSAVWGGQILSDDGKTALLDSPEVIRAAKYLVKLSDAAGGWGTYKSFVETWHEFQSDNEFAKDQAGAVVREQWAVTSLAETNPDAKIGVVPFRNQQGQQVALASGSAWAIPTGSAHPDEACKFAKTMTAAQTWIHAASVRAEKRAAEGQAYTGTFSGNVEADKVIFGELVKPSGNHYFDQALQAVLEAQEHAFSLPASPAGAEVQHAWQQAMFRALAHQQPVEDALRQAQNQAQEALDRATKRP
jgi:multiple sugar transport system substrate-binding protein